MRLKLGGIVFGFEFSTDGAFGPASEFYEPFVTSEAPDAFFRIQRRPALGFELGEPVFDSGGSWALHRADGHPVVRIRTAKFDPHQIVVLDPDYGGGDIYCIGDHWVEQDLHPLGYPMEEVLTINLLAQGRGILLHTSGVGEDGRGVLFSGVSGVGKSTMAALWDGRNGVTALSDDRMVVRQRDGQFWAYGTPWHGSARISSPEAVELERIFLIRQADENRAVRLAPMEALSRLLVASFPPFWDTEGMAFTLDFLGRLVDAVPCYELGFVPDESAVEFVRCVS